MGQWHSVRQGETVAKIAWLLGLSAGKIWDHPENAGLRNQRGNPNVLNPKDRLFIPDRDCREEAVPTDKTHTFVLRRIDTQLIRVRWLDWKYEPMAHTPYLLVAGTSRISGELGADGMLECHIPIDCEEVRVTLWHRGHLYGQGKTHTLKVGHLNPGDVTSGKKARLANLGVFHGPVDDADDPHVEPAQQHLEQKSGRNLESMHGV